MGRYDQAPRLINKKPKMDNNIIMITNEMYSAIFNAVGRKYQAGALMVWLIGQADGFGVALKTVSDALGMDKNGYYKSRAALEELGFITVNGDNITIHYNKILGNEKDAPILGNEKDDSKNRVMKKMTHSFDDSILGNEKDDSIFLGTTLDDSIFLGTTLDDPMGNEKDDPMGTTEWEYNIEEHIKTYKGSKEKLGNEKDDPILTLENFKTSIYQNSYLDEYNATGEEILDSYDFTDDSEIEEMSNEFPEAYSDLVKLGMVKRKKWSF